MLLFEQSGAAPTAPSAQPYTWHRRVKVLEGSNSAALETALNAFLATLETDATYKFGVAVLGSSTFPTSPMRLVLEYGYFTTP